MPVVLVLNRMGHPIIRELYPEAEFVVLPAEPDPVIQEELAQRIDAAMVYLPGRMSAQTIARLPRLRAVSSGGVGYHNIDVPAATRAGIPVVNHVGIPSEPVAEHAVGMMLSLSRRITQTDRLFRQRGWAARAFFQDHVSDSFGTVLLGKTVGIIGMGHIGRRIAEMCVRGIGMRAVAFSPSASDESLQQLMVERRDSVAALCRDSDYVILAGAYRPGTHHLVKASDFAVMKPEAFFINIARGGMVDQQALYEALRTNRIAGAAIDVFDPEPPDDSDPLLQLENVIVTPHVAGVAEETMRAFARSAVQQVRQMLAGEQPANLVNPEVWEKRRSL